MQKQASEDLKTKVLERTGWDPAYMNKFLGAVQECEATVRAWLAPADDFSHTPKCGDSVHIYTHMRFNIYSNMVLA